MKRLPSAVHAAPAARPAGAGAVLRLRPADVDLWRAELDDAPEETIGQLADALSPEEQDRAARFYFERDRRRFVVGRGLLRSLLAGYLGGAAEAVEFRYGPNGKPELAVPASPPLHFNVAHSEGLVVLAFTRVGALGVDVERIRDLPEWEQIAAGCFSRDEQARVEEATAGLRPVEFFRAWTRQEARLKATGEGLGGGPGWREGADAPLQNPRENPNPAFRVTHPRLNVCSLQVAGGFAAALAVPPGARWMTCLEVGSLFDLLRGPRRSRRVPLNPSAEAGIGFP